MANGEVKCVIWDLDDTLWHGTLLESEQIILKTGVREILQELDTRGILQSICSKNDYSLAMDRLKDFGIHDYFLYPQINWLPKSTSIKRLQERLRIGMDTLMFVDDQAFERDEVKAAHSEVLCFDAQDYQQLLSLACLQPRFFTEEARNRRQMYLADMQREIDEQHYEGTPESFLRSLHLRFSIERARKEDLPRVEELTIRTNQLNATGVTYSYDELERFCQSEQHLLLICELSDKYGSYGKIGIALIELQEEYWKIKLLLMSCRVISRGVGTVLLSSLARRCQREGKRLLADFRDTGRNKMMFVSYRFANFKEIHTEADGTLVMEGTLDFIPPFPPYLEITEAY
jgi:FkbH-like protein